MTRYLQQQAIFPPQIETPPSLNLGLTLVIPAREEPQLLHTLIGLSRCALPEGDVEVIVVLNGSEADGPEIRAQQEKMARQVEEWNAKWPGKSRLRFFVLEFPDLPKKLAGVGLARKIGMDEACFRFEKMGNPRGLIACFDADSRCDSNYFVEVEAFFRNRPELQACAIRFEHPLEGLDYSDEVYRSIAEYELHLRYFIQAQRYAGFPFAYQTIGSCMAVRADAYQAHGGMNWRQGMEDFYFFHQFTPLGQVANLVTTRVFPSPRPSLKSGKGYQTYNPSLFLHLKDLCNAVPDLFAENEGEVETRFRSWAPTLQSFLEEQNFFAAWRAMRDQSTSMETFHSSFFKWFNALRLMEYLLYARQRGFEDTPAVEAAQWLLGDAYKGRSAKEMLLILREKDRQ